MLGFGRKKKEPEDGESPESPAPAQGDQGDAQNEGGAIDLERHHIADLHAVAGSLGISGYRKLGRADLISSIGDAGSSKIGEALSKAVSSPTLIGEYTEVRVDRGSGGAQSDSGSQSGSSQSGGARSGGGRGQRRGGSQGGRSDGRQGGGGGSGGGRSGGGRGQGGGADRQRSRRESSEARDSRDQGRQDAGGESEDAEDETGEPVKGVLDLMPRRFGFLRLSGLEAHEGDVYVSASQVRRCELRAGDWVEGPARQPRGKERHPALIHVDSVNGSPPEAERLDFDDLTPVAPSRRLDLGAPQTGDEVGDQLVRAIDLLAPIGLGQRVLLHAGPRSGRTTVLRSLANAIDGAGQEIATLILLIDERPEEATEWLKAVPDAELSITTAEQSATEHLRAAELALQRARRQVEAGRDVVLLIDSLSRLAVAAEETDKVKAIFGAGRDLEEEKAGSLTVIATALDDGVEPDAAAAVLRTENSLVRLDADLAAAGTTPAIVVAETRVSGEESLRTDSELEAVRKLRAELSEMDPADAAKALGEKLTQSSSNSELLDS